MGSTLILSWQYITRSKPQQTSATPNISSEVGKITETESRRALNYLILHYVPTHTISICKIVPQQ